MGDWDCRRRDAACRVSNGAIKKRQNEARPISTQILMSINAILLWTWVLFGLYWLAAARRTKKSLTREFGLWRILRLAILAVTFSLLLTQWLRIGPLASRFIPDRTAIRLLGIALTAAGLLLCVWARLHLGTHWSDKVVLKVDHKLIQSGPYAHLRHPIYSGVLLGIAGTVLAVGEWRGILALLVMSVNYFVKAVREEKILAARFGADFRAYQQRAGFLAPKW